MTIVRPVGDEATLRNIDKVSYESLRPEFRAKMDTLVKKVFANMRPKSIDGQPLTGEMFANLLEQYVGAFNGGAVPSISSAWERVLVLELDKVVANAVEEYKKKAAQLSLDHLPLSEEELRKIDGEARKCAYRRFYESGLVNIGTERMIETREKMEAIFAETFEKLCAENYNVSYKDCEEFFSKLYGKIKEQMDHLEVLTFDVISSNWLKLREVRFLPLEARGSSTWTTRRVLRCTRSARC